MTDGWPQRTRIGFEFPSVKLILSNYGLPHDFKEINTSRLLCRPIKRSPGMYN